MEPLKYMFNKEFVQSLSLRIEKFYPEFDKKNFLKDIFNKNWDQLELKARMHHISDILFKHLPDDYKSSIEILLKVAPSVEKGGFQYMIFPDFVEKFGQNDWKISIDALSEFTKIASSEFAIRPFIISDPKRMVKILLKWSKHKNVHIRRLSSEGIRPRLPWAISLEKFKQDPSDIIPILENLKSDSELYVKKSVANNLNDISKDHPDLVLSICKKWIGKNENTDWIIKHGLRTLLKKGNKSALKLFGQDQMKNLKLGKVHLLKRKIKIGEELPFNFKIHLQTLKITKVRIEYKIYFFKKNGTYTSKVFKISEKNLKEDCLINKKHSFKQLSTRTHYAGIHYISIILNGNEGTKEIFTII